nr:caspase family protein [Rhizobium herbae]
MELFRVRVVMLLVLAAVALVVTCEVAEAQSDKKVALVIGNSRYANEAALVNPQNDAEDMAEVLSRIGFKVIVKFDLDYNSLRNALMEFTQFADQAEIAAVFYAGHGIEMSGTNYLIPIDARLDNESQIAFQALPLDLVLNAVNGASRLRIVFLDACRNNPFLKKLQSRPGASRSALGRGLAPIEPNEGTVVAFAAKGGTTASDGSERNSPFTKALLKHIVQPGLDVDFMLRHVRDDVMKDTGGRQEPFKYGSLPAENLTMAETEEAAAQRQKTGQGGAEAAGQNDVRSEIDKARVAWEAVSTSNNRTDMETIVRMFPGTVYADLAQARIAKITADEGAHEPGEATELALNTPGEFNGAMQRTPEQSEQKAWFMATYANIDFFGGDLYDSGLKVQSADQCAALCGSNLACRMFTYNAKAQRCFLKGSYEVAQRADGVTGGYFFKAGRSEPPPVISIQWELMVSADIRAIDLGPTNDRSYAACFQNCRSDNRCTALSFASRAKRNKCWLKGGYAGNSVDARGVVSARRAEEQVSPFRVVPALPKD